MSRTQRYEVRDWEPPHELLGHVIAPTPDELAKTRFFHDFPVSAYPFGHPRHHEARKRDVYARMQMAKLEHRPKCPCRACPPVTAFFHSGGKTVEELSYFIGFAPAIIINVDPAKIVWHGPKLAGVAAAK